MAGVAGHGNDLSIYLHVPFCSFRCAYCDFNTYAGLEHLMASYVAALCREVRLVGAEARAAAGAAVHTIFFGGGTPSLLTLDQVAALLGALRESFALTPECEITLEANPGTVSRAYLEGLRALGVSRLSLGVQSSHPHELRLLDRHHLFGDAVQALSWARAAGFDNVNLDLIFGLPHQTLAQWQATLLRVIGLGPEHISAYALSLEHGTPMRAWVYRGLLPMPDPDLAAEMYDWASETLGRHGYIQYEISNWARDEVSGLRPPASDSPASGDRRLPAYACRHNVQYWRNQPYLGLGAGAHGYAAGFRYSNVLAPSAFIQRLEQGGAAPFPFSPALAQSAPVSAEDAMGETMMMGMRLVQAGVASADFQARFGVSLAERYGRELERLTARGLIEWDGERARLTPQGRLLGNLVFREFV